jgi:hypothetical protein
MIGAPQTNPLGNERSGIDKFFCEMSRRGSYHDIDRVCSANAVTF